MEFIAATNNPGKMAEMRRILERMGHTVRSQREAGVTLEPEENGTTFAENARIKARAICEAAGTATIADDSGLCVDALDGAPGVYSARYCGRHGDDEANNDKLLEELAGVPEGKRAARFVSSICVCLPGGRCAVFEGVCPGRVGFVRRGTNGFGYDPLFIPDEVGVPGGGGNGGKHAGPLLRRAFGRGKRRHQPPGPRHGAHGSRAGAFPCGWERHRHDVRERMHHGGGQGGGLTRKCRARRAFPTGARQAVNRSLQI